MASLVDGTREDWLQLVYKLFKEKAKWTPMYALLPQMIEPSYVLDLGSDLTSPKEYLVLSSVRGIRSQGLTRGGLAYNRLGGLVYPSGTVGVVYSRREHRYAFITSALA